MSSNIDSSLDDLEKIIPSPKINTAPKDIFIEEEYNIDPMEKSKLNENIESFGDISKINEVEDEDNLNQNSKKDLLPSTQENTENSKKNKISEEIIKDSNKINKFNFDNIKSNRINNNEKKYRLLFEKNKELNIKSLREEYNKIKKDYNYNNDYKLNNYNKRYINIFNNENNINQKNSTNLFLNLENINPNINFKYKQSLNKNTNLKSKNEFDDIDFNFDYKKNSNNKKESKRNFKSQFFQDKNIFNIIKSTNNSVNIKDTDINLWPNNRIKNYKYKKLHINSMNNISNKKNQRNEKKLYVYEEYKDNNFNNNKISLNLFSRYNNNKCNNKYHEKYFYNDDKSNSKLNSIISLNKITESNNINNLEKLDDDFDMMYNLVESKIKNTPFIYKDNKFKGNKIANKLLSISQNEPLIKLIKPVKENNIINNNKYKFTFRNNFTNFNLDDKIRPYKKIINQNYKTNYDIISDFSII